MKLSVQLTSCFYDMLIFGQIFGLLYFRKYVSDQIKNEICCLPWQGATLFFFDLSCLDTSLKSYFHIREIV